MSVSMSAIIEWAKKEDEGKEPDRFEWLRLLIELEKEEGENENKQ